MRPAFSPAGRAIWRRSHVASLGHQPKTPACRAFPSNDAMQGSAHSANSFSLTTTPDKFRVRRKFAWGEQARL